MGELSMRAVDLAAAIKQLEDRVVLLGEQAMHGVSARGQVFQRARAAALLPAPRPRARDEGDGVRLMLAEGRER